MKLNKEEYNALCKIIDNNIDIELKHYEECSEEERKNHIFKDYLCLSLALKEIKMKNSKGSKAMANKVTTLIAKKGQEITDSTISKEEFQEYVNVQESAKYNMFDPRARASTSLTRSQWTYIISNYQSLMNIYK